MNEYQRKLLSYQEFLSFDHRLQPQDVNDGQNMAAGKYEGEAYIYGHQEVIEMLETISQMLLQSKQTKFIQDRLHLVVVKDRKSTRLNSSH